MYVNCDMASGSPKNSPNHIFTKFEAVVIPLKAHKIRGKGEKYSFEMQRHSRSHSHEKFEHSDPISRIVGQTFSAENPRWFGVWSYETYYHEIISIALELK